MWNHPFELFSAPTPETNADDAAGVYAAEPPTLSHRWPRCGGRMIIIEDLRTRRDAKISPECPSGRDQDRHLVIAIIEGLGLAEPLVFWWFMAAADDADGSAL